MPAPTPTPTPTPTLTPTPSPSPTPTPEPSVNISVDKGEYHVGDVMLINITLRNPTDNTVSAYFVWSFEVPEYGIKKTLIVTRITLPAGFDRTFTLCMRLPPFPVSFEACWHVALYDAETLTLISENYAEWNFVRWYLKKALYVTPKRILLMPCLPVPLIGKGG
ncbi:MAG: hypothetical protein OD815_001930 [Candidatus Alkanophagales archaeon MCA70_species_2]|nr:hypothetical protein [Candidatus Alkanophaga liquidiphilum]